MKIQFNPPTDPVTLSSPLKTGPRIGSDNPIPDSITMAKSQSTVDRIKGLFETVKNFAKTVWEYIWWAVRLFPAENTRMSAVETIIEDPKAAVDIYAKEPEEAFGELIAATLLDPQGVNNLRKKNRKEVGTFVRNFTDKCEKKETLFNGKNRILNKIKDFLAVFSKLNADHFLVSFLSDRGQIAAKAFEKYAASVLKQIGETSGKETDAIKLALGYFDKIAKSQKDNPSSFTTFLVQLFGQDKFNLEAIGTLAEKHLGIDRSPEEKEAIRACSEKKHQAVVRLTAVPHLLNNGGANLKSLNAGKDLFYTCLLEQMGSADFADLAKEFAEDHPLLKEVFEQLEDLSKNSSQYKKVCENFPNAVEVLRELWNDYQHPPAAE